MSERVRSHEGRAQGTQGSVTCAAGQNANQKEDNSQTVAVN